MHILLPVEHLLELRRYKLFHFSRLMFWVTDTHEIMSLTNSIQLMRPAHSSRVFLNSSPQFKHNLKMYKVQLLMVTISHDYTHGLAGLRLAIHRPPWLDIIYSFQRHEIIVLYCSSLNKL